MCPLGSCVSCPEKCPDVVARPDPKAYVFGTMPIPTATPTHHVHTDTIQDEEGVWWVQLILNGSPCGLLGPVAVESTADKLAEGLAEGMRIVLGAGR
jgi:hypothetical protein